MSEDVQPSKYHDPEQRMEIVKATTDMALNPLGRILRSKIHWGNVDMQQLHQHEGYGYTKDEIRKFLKGEEPWPNKPKSSATEAPVSEPNVKEETKSPIEQELIGEAVAKLTNEQSSALNALEGFLANNGLAFDDLGNQLFELDGDTVNLTANYHVSESRRPEVGKNYLKRVKILDEQNLLAKRARHTIARHAANFVYLTLGNEYIDKYGSNLKTLIEQTESYRGQIEEAGGTNGKIDDLRQRQIEFMGIPRNVITVEEVLNKIDDALQVD